MTSSWIQGWFFLLQWQHAIGSVGPSRPTRTDLIIWELDNSIWQPGIYYKMTAHNRLLTGPAKINNYKFININKLINKHVLYHFGFNSLAPAGCGSNFKIMIFQLITQNINLANRCEISLRCMPQNLTDDKSILVQVMAWCHQATSRYLNQCWPRYMSPYGVTRPYWVNKMVKIINALFDNSAERIKWFF